MVKMNVFNCFTLNYALKTVFLKIPPKNFKNTTKNSKNTTKKSKNTTFKNTPKILKIPPGGIFIYKDTTPVVSMVVFLATLIVARGIFRGVYIPPSKILVVFFFTNSRRTVILG